MARGQGWRAAVAALLLAGLAGQAQAQERPGQGAAPAPEQASETDCATAAWPLEDARARLTGTDLPPVMAGRRLDPQAGAVELVLQPQSGVAFIHPPERPAAVDGFGGTFVVPIARAGLWQVTLSDNAWIDVVAGGRLVPAAAFTGVHHCPGVRKSVRFALKPGPVILQLSGAPTARLKIVVTALD